MSDLIKSNSQLDSEQSARDAEAATAIPDTKAVVLGLSGYLAGAWENAKRAKMGIEQRMLKSMRQRNGQYEPAKLTAIRQLGGSEVFVMLTSAKIRAAKAWVMDILRSSGSRVFSVDPTPGPELPPDVMAEIEANVQAQVTQNAIEVAAQTGQPVTDQLIAQVAQEQAENIKSLIDSAVDNRAKQIALRMEDKIDDQLVEGGWMDALNQVVDDICAMPAGIIKGPVIRKRNTQQWVMDASGWSLKSAPELVMEFERVSPLDIYPEADSTGIDDGFLFEHHRLSRMELNRMIGVPGYNDAEIRAVLDEHGRGGLKEWMIIDQERAAQENRESTTLIDSTKIDALEYWGSVQGRMLIEWGMDTLKVPDPLLDYEVNAWKIGTHVIKAVLNPDQTGRKPYGKASFENVPGSFWGNSLPERISDSQDVCNASSRALVNNTALASGPMCEVDVDRLAPGESVNAIRPWLIIRTTNKMMSEQPAVRFYQPNPMMAALVTVYDKFSLIADEESGIPKYVAGDPNVAAAGGTASGLSMLMSASARGVKEIIGNIDSGIIGPVLTRVYEYNMRFDTDQGIKGDAKVKARGVSSLMAKENRIMRIGEILERSNNPIDVQITGLDGRREMWKEQIKSAEMDVDKVLPEKNVKPQSAVPSKAPGIPPSNPTTLDSAGNPVGDSNMTRPR